MDALCHCCCGGSKSRPGVLGPLTRRGRIVAACFRSRPRITRPYDVRFTHYTRPHTFRWTWRNEAALICFSPRCQPVVMALGSLPFFFFFSDHLTHVQGARALQRAGPVHLLGVVMELLKRMNNHQIRNARMFIGGRTGSSPHQANAERERERER